MYCLVVKILLNMFRALQCPSSGARQTAVAASGFSMDVEVEVFSAVVGLLVFESRRWHGWSCNCKCCVLSGRSLCDELNTHPEESCRLCCVVVCDPETSRIRRPWPALDRSTTGKKIYKKQYLPYVLPALTLVYSEFWYTVWFSK